MLASLHRQNIVPEARLVALARPVAGTDQVGTDQLAQLWRDVARVMDDEFLGLSQRPMPSGSFALMCHSVLHAGTLGQALPRMLDFLRIVLGNLSGTMTVKDGQVRISLADRDARSSAFGHRMYWILVLGLSCWLVGRRIPLRQVDFQSDLPPADEDYRHFFGAPVRFGQVHSCLVFDDRFLALPIRRDEAALHLFLKNAPGNILIRYRQDSDLAARISGILQRQQPVDWPAADGMAHRAVRPAHCPSSRLLPPSG